MKLNQGFSGKGNASIDLQCIQRRFAGCKVGDNEATLRIAKEIEKELATNLKCKDPKMTWLDTQEQVGFQTQINRLGVIAEVFIEGEVPTSPSIQAVVEAKDVFIISTHEQVLDGQVYKGCINPCKAAYRASIMEAGLKVGKFLAAHGVRGHFSVDFLACKQPKSGSWDVYADTSTGHNGTPLRWLHLLRWHIQDQRRRIEVLCSNRLSLFRKTQRLQ